MRTAQDACLDLLARARPAMDRRFRGTEHRPSIYQQFVGVICMSEDTDKLRQLWGEIKQWTRRR